MKRILTSLCLLLCLGTTQAQDITTDLTFYKEFRPAIIHLTNGKDLRNGLTNIFLKNGALLYKQGLKTMEANMETILGADFGDQKFVKIDKMLALLTDTVGPNSLYQATVIDIEAYNRLLRNNVNITNLTMSEQLSYTTIDLEPQEGISLPVINHFYYKINNKMVRVHERELSRVLPKEKKRIYKTIIGMPGFKWTDHESLVRLLKAITEDEATPDSPGNE